MNRTKKKKSKLILTKAITFFDSSFNLHKRVLVNYDTLFLKNKNKLNKNTEAEIAQKK